MDGVLYNSECPIPGADTALVWVREQRIPHLFVTNTTSRPRAVLADKLRGFGIPAQESDILTPAIATSAWLRAHAPDAQAAIFVRPATRADFAGIATVPDDAETGASHVIIGDLGELWDFRTLNRAFRLLHNNPQSTLVALGMTRYWLARDGIALDVAPFVAALEHATGKRAQVFGKPAPAFFLAAADLLRVPAAEILMVGDDVNADIGGAQASGLRGALVKTGKFRPADLEGPVRPDVVLGSVTNLPQWWASQEAKVTI
jgi:phospholysine phosphohistidine inorganic pyrophosphate phosphatase